jgi:penicillin amidase
MKRWGLHVAFFLSVATAVGVAQEPIKVSVEKLMVDGETVIIFRDDYGVPRVFAPSVHSLFVGDGYAVAQDRAWQMEKYRLDATGRLAEAFGEKFLDHDKEVRRDGMTREEWRGEFDHLPADLQEIFRSYVEGVNRYLEKAQTQGTLPEEFAKNHWKAAPWSVEDSMAIGGMMGRRFGASGADHLRNEAVIEYLAKRLGTREAALKVFDDIAWTDDPAAIPTVEARAARKPATAAGPSPQAFLQPSSARISVLKVRSSIPGIEELLTLDGQFNSAAVYAAAKELQLPTRWGSYTWVLAPSKSVSGDALLVGGPQMGFSVPQIAHEVQLTGAGFNVMGMGFAGVPGILIGANDHLAWTSTSGESHNEDVFVEKLKSDDEHQYLYQGTYHPMEHRVEQILVKDKPALDYDVYRTVHGPVISWSPRKDIAYSKQMAYFGKEFSTAEAFLKLNTAQHIQDIPPLAAKIASSHNILVATQDGDIGFWHCGYFPVYAKGVDPRLPLRGTGEDDWQGFVPFGRLPQVVNPAGGIIFNWNNKPASAWKYYGGPAWGVAFHISNIRTVLERELKEHGGKLSLTDVERVAPEIGRRNYIADWLKPGLLEAATRGGTKLGPEARQAVEYLRHWDNELADGSVAQTIFDAWYQHLRRDVFAETLGDLGGKNLFDEFVNSSTVYHALAGPASSVRLSRDYLGKRSADEVRLKALEETVSQLRQERGADMSLWGTRTEWIKFDPLPSIPWYSRGTYIQAVVLAKPRVHGMYILPPGQSEDPHSPHYSDQLSLAGWWMFVPMELKPEPPTGQKAEGRKQ